MKVFNRNRNVFCLHVSFKTRSGKLKSMTSYMDKVVDSMINHLRSSMNGKEGCIFDMQEVYRSVTLDTIANCAFGIEFMLAKREKPMKRSFLQRASAAY